MKRLLVIAALAFSGVVASPAQASASLMDWLQELSGPGPFNAKNLNVIVDLCPSRQFLAKSGDARNLGPFANDYDKPADAARPLVCLFIDNRWFQNDGAGDNFGAGRV